MNEKKWAEETARRIHEKELHVAARNREKIPYTARDGVFDDRSKGADLYWWTNGFWAGQLWQLYHAFKEPLYREIAQRIEEKLDPGFMNYLSLDHDTGFKWLLTAVADWRVSQSEASKNRGLLAAISLLGRLNLKAGLIRAWNDEGSGEMAGLAIIDCMMNLPLLYWASEVTKDPRFAQAARLHAQTAAGAFIRENGSSRHIVTFDPFDGHLLGESGGQGMGKGSSWSRGQAWALYGFTLSYRHSREALFLQTAEKVADHLLELLPRSGLIPVDYDQPKDCPFEDGSASSITACGLLELSRYTDEKRAVRAREGALILLHALAEQGISWDSETDPFVLRASASYDEEKHNYPIIYADYYFTEAILKLTGQELFLW